MQPIALEGFLEQTETAKAKEWLEYGWKRGAELVGGKEILYDDWWKKMQRVAAGFWGCIPDSRIAVDLVRPMFWEQGGKVWKYDGQVNALNAKEEVPSRLIAINGGCPPCYKDDYTVYILANIEKAKKGNRW
ncbi:MAG: hypothetical protein V1887_03155 [Candidatus Aenigmatarchaeota archaeon]